MPVGRAVLVKVRKDRVHLGIQIRHPGFDLAGDDAPSLCWKCFHGVGVLQGASTFGLPGWCFFHPEIRQSRRLRPYRVNVPEKVCDMSRETLPNISLRSGSTLRQITAHTALLLFPITDQY